MSILGTLKLSAARRTADANDPVIKARINVVRAINEQREAIAAEKKGEKFAAKRGRGEKAVEKKFRPWFFRQGAVMFTEVRYGVSALDLGGGTAIECGKGLDDVLETYEVVERAIEAGELDAQLKAASAKRGRKGTKPDTAPAAKPKGK